MLFDENTPYDFKITCPLFADDLPWMMYFNPMRMAPWSSAIAICNGMMVDG